MRKQILLRALCSFCVTGTVNTIIMLVMAYAMPSYQHTPFMPDFLACFPSESVAFGVETLLISMIGAAFGGCSVIYDMEKWSFLKQGLIHFIITTAVWFPITMFIWNAIKYPTAGFGIMGSYSFVYATTWIMSGIKNKKQIEEINRQLQEKNTTSENNP